MKKLSTRDFSYMAILYIIWQLSDYYSSLFGIVVEDNPTLLLPELHHKKGYSFLRFTFQRVENEVDKIKTGYYGVRDIQNIFNEYLQIVLLPNAHSYLQPYYSSNKNDSDFMECLYVNEVYVNNEKMTIDVIYIDRPDAYYYVQLQHKNQH